MPQKYNKLNRYNLRKLAPGQIIREKGIEFERLPDGDGRFSVDIVVDGQRVHRVIGKERDGVTLTQAEQYIEKVRTEAREGRLKLPKGRKTHMKFSEAAEKYIKRLEEGGGKDLVSKRSHLKNHLLPYFGDKVLSQISAWDISRFQKMRQDAGVKPGTINRELQTLSHIFTKAIEWKWIEQRPCQLKKLKEPPSRFVYLTVEQSRRLLEAAKEDACPVIYPFVLIALNTCMRRGEILSIRLEDIDLDRRIIYVPKAKAGAREQPMTKALAEYLGHIKAQAPANQEWLFPSPNSKSGHTEWLEKPFRRVVEAAGLDPKQVTRHTLRHTAITHLVQAGIDLVTVQRISGHHSIDMVARYAHANGQHIQTAMDKLEARYLSAV